MNIELVMGTTLGKKVMCIMPLNYNPYRLQFFYEKYDANSNAKKKNRLVSLCLLMKAIVGSIYSLGYELCITANRLFLPCLTYCGPRFVTDDCFYLDSLPQCSSPTLRFPSLCYCLILALQRQRLQ